MYDKVSFNKALILALCKSHMDSAWIPDFDKEGCPNVFYYEELNVRYFPSKKGKT